MSYLRLFPQVLATMALVSGCIKPAGEDHRSPQDSFVNLSTETSESQTKEEVSTLDKETESSQTSSQEAVTEEENPYLSQVTKHNAGENGEKLTLSVSTDRIAIKSVSDEFGRGLPVEELSISITPKDQATKDCSGKSPEEDDSKKILAPNQTYVLSACTAGSQSSNDQALVTTVTLTTLAEEPEITAISGGENDPYEMEISVGENPPSTEYAILIKAEDQDLGWINPETGAMTSSKEDAWGSIKDHDGEKSNVLIKIDQPEIYKTEKEVSIQIIARNSEKTETPSTMPITSFHPNEDRSEYRHKNDDRDSKTGKKKFKLKKEFKTRKSKKDKEAKKEKNEKSESSKDQNKPKEKEEGKDKDKDKPTTHSQSHQ